MSESALVERSRPKVPLDQASSLLEELCDRVESGEGVGSALTEVFNETRLDLADAVDRRIAFDIWIKGSIITMEGARDEYATRAKRLKMIHEAFKENTRFILEAHPNLPYKGQLGRISVQNNPPKLNLAFHERYVTPDMIEHFGIDESYVKTEVIHSIDTAKVKADLLLGKDIPWAAIAQEKHVRFRK